MSSFFIFITHVGSPEVLIALACLGSIFLVLKGKRTDALYFLGSVGCTAAAALILKYLIARPRPLFGLIAESGPSFPSAHAALATVFFSYVILLYGNSCKTHINKSVFILFNISIIFLISYSRIYLGVHYVSDVLAGIILGLFIYQSSLYIRYQVSKPSSKIKV